MARILNIKPPCGYTLEGITEVILLDFDDFKGFKFEGDDLYNNCLVVGIIRVGNFTDVPAPETAKYSSAINNKIYAHSVETFSNELSAYQSANLHLALQRRYIVVFKTKVGRYYTFGYEAGAVVTYSNQTADAIGALITISAPSIYPLFEVSPEAITTNPVPSDFLPGGAYCEPS